MTAEMIALICGALVPITGLITGFMVDRRNKQAAKITAEQARATIKTTAREAATHEFEAITSGFTEYTSRLEGQNARLEARIAHLETEDAKKQDRIERLETKHRLTMEHLSAVEALVEPALLPPRPRGLQ